MEPVPNDPLDIAEPTQSAALPTEEGTVYGVTPKEPTDPPDIDLLFEYADIPGGRDGGLPYSLEWYQGAKARQEARDKEKERLEERKLELRKNWVREMEDGLTSWIAKVDAVTAALDGEQAEISLRGLAELVARASEEDPDNLEKNSMLQEALTLAEQEDAAITQKLLTSRDGLQKCYDFVEGDEREALEQDERQAAARREAEARKARAEEELRRQEAMLRGEDPDAPPAPKPPPAEEAAPLRPPVPPGGPGPAASPSRSPAVTPPEGMVRKLSRGGLATELPPLQDPPRPGSGSSRGRVPSPP